MITKIKTTENICLFIFGMLVTLKNLKLYQCFSTVSNVTKTSPMADLIESISTRDASSSSFIAANSLVSFSTNATKCFTLVCNSSTFFKHTVKLVVSQQHHGVKDHGAIMT